MCGRREDEGGVGLRIFVSKHNGESEKALQQSLQQPPLVSMETDTDLHFFWLWFYSRAQWQRSRWGGARGE